MAQRERPYDFIRDGGFEALFATLGTKEGALDEDYGSEVGSVPTGAGTENDFPIAQLQLSGEATNV